MNAVLEMPKAEVVQNGQVLKAYQCAFDKIPRTLGNTRNFAVISP